MILSVMQPTYLPWLGYFALIQSADKFVFLDDVKLEKSDWHIRNRIKAKNQPLMLSCHVSTPNGRSAATIENTSFVKETVWKKKHLKSIYENYNKTDYFEELFPILSSVFEKDNLNTVAQFNIALIKALMDYIGISTPTYISSKLSNVEGVKDSRLVSLCNILDCNVYLSPMGAKNYIEEFTPGGQLVKNNIDVYYQNFEHPEYIQRNGSFESHLSAIDSLFNVGPNKTAELIKNSTKQALHYSDLY